MVGCEKEEREVKEGTKNEEMNNARGRRTTEQRKDSRGGREQCSRGRVK